MDAYSTPASCVVGMTMCLRCLGSWPKEYPGRNDDFLGDVDVLLLSPPLSIPFSSLPDKDNQEVECAPPGEMDAPLALVSRVSSLGPTTRNGNGGNTIGPIVILSFFCPYIWQVQVAIFVGLLSMSNMVTESMSLHNTLSNFYLSC